MSLEEEVKRLAFQVPAPPNEELPTGTDERAIAGFETRTGLVLPTSVREWLQFMNGPRIGPGGLLGIRPQHSSLGIEEVLRWYPCWKERGWAPVAGDGCGNYYVVNTTENGGIYFIDTAEDSENLAYAVASDVWRFLWFLLSRELGQNGWPFDGAYVMSHDPDIRTCTSASLPWNA